MVLQLQSQSWSSCSFITEEHKFCTKFEVHLLIKYLLWEHSSSCVSQSQAWLQALSHRESLSDLSRSAKTQRLMHISELNRYKYLRADRVRPTVMIRSSSVGRGWENSGGMPASACDAGGYVTWRDRVQQGYVTGLESLFWPCHSHWQKS